MSFNFEDLNQNIREKMLEEVNLDISNKVLFFSKRLNQDGLAKYQDLLIDSIKFGNEQTFADSMRQLNIFNATERRSNGTVAKVPSNAHEVLAGGEFNRFYIRALALVAIAEAKKLEVYRAKQVTSARSDSEQKIGALVEPALLLADLRKNIGIDTFLGLPGGVNSGLSVKLV